MRAALLLLASLISGVPLAAAPGQALLDDFEDPAAWNVVASDDVKAMDPPGARDQRPGIVPGLRLREGIGLRGRAAVEDPKVIRRILFP